MNRFDDCTASQRPPLIQRQARRVAVPLGGRAALLICLIAARASTDASRLSLSARVRMRRRKRARSQTGSVGLRAAALIKDSLAALTFCAVR